MRKIHTKVTITNAGSQWLNLWSDTTNSNSVKKLVSEKLNIPIGKFSINYTASGHTDKV